MQIYLSAAAVRMIGVHGNQVNNYRRACVRVCVLLVRRSVGAPGFAPSLSCPVVLAHCGVATPRACVLMDRYYNAVRIEPCSQRMN